MLENCWDDSVSLAYVRAAAETVENENSNVGVAKGRRSRMGKAEEENLSQIFHNGDDFQLELELIVLCVTILDCHKKEFYFKSLFCVWWN